MTVATQIESRRLADQLERSFRGGAWHGPSLSEALAGLSAADAHRRVVPGAHTVAEIAWHAAFWLDAARRRITGEATPALVEGADFPPPAADPEAAWADTLGRLEAAHRGLYDAVAELDDERLDGPAAGSDPTVRGLLLGVLQHSAYHGGQIVLLRKALAGG